MTDQGLWCACTLPLNWSPLDAASTAPAALEHEALLLLTAINQMESVHDLESGGGTDHRRLDRLESKLDLALYLLARTLEPGPAPAPREARLSPEEIRWRDEAPPAEGTPLLLELRASPALPLAVRLPVMALGPEDGWARASFLGLAEPLADALHQFIFRRHRQAIRAKHG
jgi:hypothetical protein